ncbi:MAG: hypothetical protein AB7O73_07705 [Bacteroidia bacterium]
MKFDIIRYSCFLSIIMLVFACSNSSKSDGAISISEPRYRDKTELISILNQVKHIKKENLINVVQSEDGIFKYHKRMGEFNFQVHFEPTDYIILKENKDLELDESLINIKRKELGETKHFTLRIWSDKNRNELLKYKLEDESQYSNRLAYYANSIINDIKIIVNNDTIKPSVVHFERTFGIDPFLTFTMVFDENLSLSGDLTFCYFDRVFENGNINIKIPKEIILRQPTLKT